jgi:hypothetical protein
MSSSCLAPSEICQRCLDTPRRGALGRSSFDSSYSSNSSSLCSLCTITNLLFKPTHVSSNDKLSRLDHRRAPFDLENVVRRSTWFVGGKRVFEIRSSRRWCGYHVLGLLGGRSLYHM